MAVQISWQVEKRMILVDIDGSMTIDELGQMNDEIMRFLEEGQAPIHIIFDLRDAMPRIVNPNEIAAASQFLKSPKLGLHSMVSSNRVINFLGTIVHNLLGSHQAYVTESLDDAVARLKRMDASIQALHAECFHSFRRR